MVDKKIKLSICMTTYNHEKYIKQSVDSVLAQKVDFDYELIIGDDASADDTQKILLENYANDPRVVLILHKENLYNKLDSPNNSYYVREKVKGEYVISIEGDDYWTDLYFLQKMSDWLDNNMDCVGIAGHMMSLSEKQGIYWKDYDSSFNGRKLGYEDYAKEPGRSIDRIAIMFRNFYNDGLYDYRLYNINRYIGDLSSLIQIFLHGKVYQSDMVIGVHRVDRMNGASNYNSLFSHRQTYERHLDMISRFPQMIDDSLDYSILNDYYTKNYLNSLDTKEEVIRIFPILFKYLGMHEAVRYTKSYIWEKTSKNKAIEKYKQKEKEQLDKIKLLIWLDNNIDSVIDYVKKGASLGVAIYGKGFVGERLIKEFKENGVNLKYIIDKNSKHKYDPVIPIVSLEDDLEQVDLIIISLLTDIESIRNEIMSKINTKIVDIESIVYKK